MHSIVQMRNFVFGSTRNSRPAPHHAPVRPGRFFGTRAPFSIRNYREMTKIRTTGEAQSVAFSQTKGTTYSDSTWIATINRPAGLSRCPGAEIRARGPAGAPNPLPPLPLATFRKNAEFASAAVLHTALMSVARIDRRARPLADLTGPGAVNRQRWGHCLTAVVASLTDHNRSEAVKRWHEGDMI